MKMKWGMRDLALVLIGFVPLVLFGLLYDQLPDRMATHFNLTGEADGWQGKGSFLTIMTLLSLGLPLLFKLPYRIDPRAENYEKFMGVMELFRMAVALLISGITVVTILFNVGYALNMKMVAMLGIGSLFIVLGNYMGQVRPNYFVGIKTPWTLANEEVWRRTHRASAPLMVVTGLVGVACAFLPATLAAWVFGVTVLGTMIAFPLLYSYRVWKKLAAEGK